MITGKTLIEWGFDPKGVGKAFGEAIKEANTLRAEGASDKVIQNCIRHMMPVPPPEIPLRTNSIPFDVFLEPENDEERANLAAVVMKMDEYMRIPTVVGGTVLPDACPTGDMPVGTVIATKDAIHPGFHSPDVCCSMAITVFKRKDDLKKILDTAQAITHFGPGGRKDGFKLPPALRMNMDGNPFLQNRDSKYGDIAESNLGTQGDGNHFMFVGTLRSTGQPAIVTHHGSRGVGALLYKRGMQAAKRHTAIHSPRTPDKAAWIPGASAQIGRDYWDALQLVRQWTKYNHYLLHDAIQRALGNLVVDRFWNEHNFVFYRNGLYYHAKGATPSFAGFSPDDDGRTLIPMNMAEPILITRHADKPEALGFAPHGAGRNMSRTAYMKRLYERYPIPPRFDGDGTFSAMDLKMIAREQAGGVDARFYLGKPDVSELPGAYKSAEQVQRSIKKHRLADVVDYVDPYGCIMAGETAWQRRK